MVGIATHAAVGFRSLALESSVDARLPQPGITTCSPTAGHHQPDGRPGGVRQPAARMAGAALMDQQPGEWRRGAGLACSVFLHALCLGRPALWADAVQQCMCSASAFK